MSEHAHEVAGAAAKSDRLSRAGAQGRGFAVVADEVRRLAELSRALEDAAGRFKA